RAKSMTSTIATQHDCGPHRTVNQFDARRQAFQFVAAVRRNLGVAESVRDWLVNLFARLPVPGKELWSNGLDAMTHNKMGAAFRESQCDYGGAPFVTDNGFWRRESDDFRGVVEVDQSDRAVRSADGEHFAVGTVHEGPATTAWQRDRSRGPVIFKV